MKWEIYKDKNREKEPKTLKGFNGVSYLEPGFVFAPYVPIQVSQIQTNPIHKRLRKAGLKLGRKPVVTRYQKKVVKRTCKSGLVIKRTLVIPSWLWKTLTVQNEISYDSRSKSL